MNLRSIIGKIYLNCIIFMKGTFIILLELKCVLKNQYKFKNICQKAVRSKKKYFVIYREVEDIGLGSQIYVALHQIEVAENLKFIPVIYRKYFDQDISLYINQWEICFEPFVKKSIEEIMNCRNTLVWDSKNTLHVKNHDFWEMSENKLRKYQSLFNKYIKLNEEMQIRINNDWNSMFNSEDRILGILARGTDYNQSVAFNHPRQPSITEIIEQASLVIKNYGCNKIFIATEDQDILNGIRKAFGENVVRYIKQERFSLEERKTINCQIREKEIDKIKMLKDYVTAIYILSKCNCLIAGNTSASQLLPIIDNQFEYMFRFDLGNYDKGDMNSIIR